MEEGLFSQIIVNYLVSILSSFFTLFLANTVYKIKPNIKTIIVYVLALATITTSVLMVSSEVFSYIESLKLIKPLVILIIKIISVKFLLDIYFRQSIIICALITLITGFSEITVYFLMKIIGFDPKNALNNLLAFTLSNFAIYAVAVTIVFIIRGLNLISELPKTIRTNAYRYVISTILVSIIIILSFTFVALYNIKNTTLYLVFIIAVLINIYMSFYSIHKIVKIDISEQELELQKFYNQSMADIIDKLRMYKHDTGNMLNTINGYLKLNKFDRLTEYIKEHVADMDNTNNLIAIGNIKNAALYGIVSSKINRAQKTGVNMQVTIIGEINEINNIKISQLCEILGIYLDNAIEACNQSLMKIVNLIIKNNPDSTIFTIENTYDSNILNIDKLGELGYSTKGDGHGTGLYIVKKLLSNNERVINNTSIKYDYFTQELIIKNN